MAEYLSIIKDLAFLVAFAYGAYALDSWRREHVGRKRLDLVEDVLSQFYEARDAISSIRFPGGLESETAAGQRADKETEEEFHARKTASEAEAGPEILELLRTGIEFARKYSDEDEEGADSGDG